MLYEVITRIQFFRNPHRNFQKKNFICTLLVRSIKTDGKRVAVRHAGHVRFQAASLFFQEPEVIQLTIYGFRRASQNDRLMDAADRIYYTPRDYREIPIWKDIEPGQWNSPEWQLKNTIRNTKTLGEVIRLSPAQAETIDVITSYSIHYTKLYDHFHPGTFQ